MKGPSTRVPAYVVLVRSNSHYQDEDEEYRLGEFDDCQNAIRACKEIVDDFLAANLSPGITSDGLYRQYTMFGEDPFIVSSMNDCPFSAWSYAKERCTQICDEMNK